VITLPKRKLPQLWYRKSSYKKERENEIDRLSEPIQDDRITQPTVIDETKTPFENVNQPPQTEGESEVTPKNDVGNVSQSEKPSTSIISREQVFEKGNEAKVELNNEKAPTLTVTQETLLESDSNHPSTEKETQKTPQIDNSVPSIDGQEKQALIELKWVKDQDKLADPLTCPNPELVTPIVESVKEVTPADIENKVPLTASVENIEKYTDSLTRLLPTKAVISIGEYPINIALKGSLGGKKDEGVLPIFVEKSTKDVIKWGQGRLDQNNIVCLDEDIDTHFWYDILPFVADNENFFAKIKSKPINNLKGAIIVSSTWNGIGSALLPSLNAQFKEWNINSIALPLLPSKAQPLDGQFNTFASIGILSSRGTTLLLVDRDNLENYSGIDRNGFAINGNTVANYLLDLMLTKETFVQELCELSNSFDSKMFTVFLASGMSLKIYDSIENMLNTTLLRPFFTFDLSSATLLYVLIRMPFHLKEKLPSEKIEAAVANWFKDKANLESIYISDPVYVEDSGDRIDIAMFVGGFETATRFAELEKRVTKMKSQAVKKGLITEEDWQAITKSLL
jgi:hypothetical protein